MYEKFAPVIARQDLTTGEFDFVEAAVTMPDSGANEFLKIVGGVLVNASISSGTFADESMTDSGDHTLFTILHVPTIGSLLVINENTGQVIPTSFYTNIGANITFGSSQEIDGETPVFRARYSY